MNKLALMSGRLLPVCNVIMLSWSGALWPAVLVSSQEPIQALFHLMPVKVFRRVCVRMFVYIYVCVCACMYVRMRLFM